jgi:hypothetical protein
MDAAGPSQEQRSEMELILRSGVFERSPRLGRFFRYVCERHFEGNADQIKEYSIAVEALGRPSNFDPKKDSIVRVEAHRLRKRLEEYYLGPGAADAIEIVVPSGQYRPEFRNRAGNAANTTAEKIENTVELDRSGLAFLDSSDPMLPTLPTAKSVPKLFFRRWIVGAVVAMLAVCSAYLLWRAPHKSVPHKSKTAPDERNTETASRPAGAGQSGGAELRLLAGYQGPVYMDRQGHLWEADGFFKGGSAKPITADHLIEGQPDPRLLRSTRFGNFRYDIPLRQGTYELHLYFAETEYGRGNELEGGDSARTFDVGVNGQNVFTAFDPLAEAGAPNRLLQRVLKDVCPGSDGKLHLSFESRDAAAMLSGIELLPSQPGRMHPVRIVMQSSPVTDSDGRLWAADEYFYGGSNVSRGNVLLNPKERSLYQGERFGNFCYRIPLAPGKYRLTLYFAEQWFGTEAGGMLSPDHREFDVFANRETLLKDFIPAAEAGGVNRCFEKTFTGIAPNAQGMLLLEFVPIRNYAEVNAIEVVETQ